LLHHGIERLVGAYQENLMQYWASQQREENYENNDLVTIGYDLGWMQ
jgi:hypothetical protein